VTAFLRVHSRAVPSDPAAALQPVLNPPESG